MPSCLEACMLWHTLRTQAGSPTMGQGRGLALAWQDELDLAQNLRVCELARVTEAEREHSAAWLDVPVCLSSLAA